MHVEIPLDPPGPKPAIISLIGNEGRMMRAGFVVATFTVNWAVVRGPAPTPLPAERAVGKWVLASPSAGVLGRTYLHDIAETATRFVPVIVDWLSTVAEIDATRIGMAGGSTNGFITLQAIAVEPRLRAAAAIAACADYRGFLRDSSMGMAGKPLALDPSYDRWVRSQEIIEDPSRVVHSALLMINRVGDELIPVACADRTAEVLTRAYERAGAAQRFRYVRSDTQGHGIGDAELRTTLDWFQRWLQAPAPAP